MAKNTGLRIIDVLQQAYNVDGTDAESNHCVDFLFDHCRKFLNVLLENLKLLICLDSLFVE